MTSGLVINQQNVVLTLGGVGDARSRRKESTFPDLSCSLRSDALASLRRDKQKIYFFATSFFQLPTTILARTPPKSAIRPFTLMLAPWQFNWLTEEAN